MDDLSSRLLSAIEETERRARACGDPATAGAWYYSEPHGETVRSEAGDYVACGPWEGVLDVDYARHIAHNDPSSVLRRCAADRRIVERHQPRLGVEGPHEGKLICGCSYGDDEWYATPFPCADIADIAEGYGLTDHQEGE